MKPIPSQTLRALAARFGYDPGKLHQIGGGRRDSDGIAYAVTAPGGRYVFKVVGADANNRYARQSTQARADFFAYLGANGLHVVAPEPNADGNLTEMETANGDAFIAYTYPYMTGEHPSPKTSDARMIGAWGRTIGAAHRLAKDYPIFDGIAIDEYPNHRLLRWREEVRSFTRWCADADVRAAWHQLEEALCRLPQTRDDVGFVHNDPHMANVLYEDGCVKLLDFDVAICHFFAADLAIAMQSVLFSQSGGLSSPVRDQEALRRFASALLDGYARENALPKDAEARINLFIAYRRALLFTVMQDGLKARPNDMAAWKRMILDAPRVLAL